jgi:hypothetical protein
MKLNWHSEGRIKKYFPLVILILWENLGKLNVSNQRLNIAMSPIYLNAYNESNLVLQDKGK